jgi:hypothetical protein
MRKHAIVIAGSLSQKPRHGGHTWALMQYALGFRELGWDVLFLDQIESSLCVDAAGHPAAVIESVNARFLDGLMNRFGLGDDYALIVDQGRQWIGLDRERVIERVRTSTFLLNVMGFLSHAELLSTAPRRVFLDIDPGFGQMWKDLQLHDAFAGHDAFITIGERIGEEDCAVPTCGLTWITTPQPIVLSQWPAIESPSRRFTSVVSWRGAYGPIEYHGKTYGLRVHEFRKFIDLPRRTGLPFELALDIHPDDGRDRARLESSDWTLVDPTTVAGSPERYREYVQSSGAEFMVAKNMYVDTRSGWLSDRSLCYLASGKPVLAQETGWTLKYPAGTGLVPFRSLEEAEEGARSIAGNYAHHARAARALAQDYFDANRVLSRIVAKLGASI